jgi:hypothetical protein
LLLCAGFVVWALSAWRVADGHRIGWLPIVLGCCLLLASLILWSLTPSRATWNWWL